MNSYSSTIKIDAYNASENIDKLRKYIQDFEHFDSLSLDIVHYIATELATMLTDIDDKVQLLPSDYSITPRSFIMNADSVGLIDTRNYANLCNCDNIRKARFFITDLENGLLDNILDRVNEECNKSRLTLDSLNNIIDRLR